MSICSRRSSVVLLAVAAIGTGALLGFAGWPEPGRTLEFCALILAGVVTASFATRSSTLDWTTMLPSFVVDFTTLLLLGPHATMLVVAAGAVARGLTDPGHALPARRTLMDAAAVLTATLAAGLVYSALGGTTEHFTWPEQALPIAGAVVAYCLVRAVLADVIVPLATRQPVNRSWLRRFLQGCQHYCIGGQPRDRTRRADRPPELAADAGGGSAAVFRLPRLLGARQRASKTSAAAGRSSSASIRACLSSTAAAGSRSGTTASNTSWAVLAQGALGRPLVAAVPALAKTELPRAIGETLTTRSARMMARIELPSPAGVRILQVKMLPVADGVTLLWHDVTERAQAEQALKRSEERLALAAEGAERRVVGVGSSEPGVLRVGPMEGDGRPAGDRRHRSSRGMD